MNFEDLKDAVKFETILVNKMSAECKFISFSEDNTKIFTTWNNDNDCIRRNEEEIEDWTIKPKEKEKKKLYAYNVAKCIDGTGALISWFTILDHPTYSRMPEFDLEF